MIMTTFVLVRLPFQAQACLPSGDFSHHSLNRLVTLVNPLFTESQFQCCINGANGAGDERGRHHHHVVKIVVI